jgi:hypothetical protein
VENTITQVAIKKLEQALGQVELRSITAGRALASSKLETQRSSRGTYKVNNGSNGGLSVDSDPDLLTTMTISVAASQLEMIGIRITSWTSQYELTKVFRATTQSLSWWFFPVQASLQRIPGQQKKK